MLNSSFDGRRQPNPHNSMYNSLGLGPSPLTAQQHANTFHNDGDSRVLYDEGDERGLKYSEGNLGRAGNYGQTRVTQGQRMDARGRMDMSDGFDGNSSVDNFRRVRGVAQRNNNNISIYDYREDRRNMSMDQSGHYNNMYPRSTNKRSYNPQQYPPTTTTPSRLQ